MLYKLKIPISQNALFYAAVYDNIEAVEILLKDPNVDINRVIDDADGRVVDLLLKDPRVDPTKRLFKAVKQQDVGLIKLLINDPRININHPDFKQKVFYEAYDSDQIEFIGILIANPRIYELFKSDPEINELLDNLYKPQV